MASGGKHPNGQQFQENELIEDYEDEDETEKRDEQEEPREPVNLLSNDTSRKNQKRKIRMADEATSCQWGYIMTQIIDTGEGIDPKCLKNLF